MLRSVEIRAVLAGAMRAEPLHDVRWLPTLQLSLDCFVCERTRRTTILEQGAERAVCTSDKQHGRHFTAARVAVLDSAAEDDQLTLRAVVEYWSAPFHDLKRDRQATANSTTPWVRLYFSYRCPQHNQTGKDSIQTNLVRPRTIRCSHCHAALAISNEAPAIRLLE
jgi:hypothetical protein